MNQINSQTKIIATLGPACSSKNIIRQMICEGVDVFRLNFSHSSQSEHLKLINIIKECNLELGTNVAILADLQGPKLRIGEIENNSIMLTEGDIINFTTTNCIGNKEHIYMSYSAFPQDVNAGDTILIDDGKIKLEVIDTNKHDSVRAKVIYGGTLSSKKGVNLPNTNISQPSLSEEDISNAIFALDQSVDWIALSFVRKASDVSDLKNLMIENKGYAGIIAKIEKPEALREIDQIIDIADGIMVARGDLGVEVPFDQVPCIQKSIVNKCISKSKPVIIATQMMESMLTNFRPTRAEANDVANSVLDRADALMLSGETSVGRYPIESIKSMQQIISYTEANGNISYIKHIPIIGSRSYLADSICYNAAKLAEQVGAKAIITFTHSGYTSIKISSYRPNAEIYAFTNNKSLLHRISLVWGIRPLYLSIYTELEKAIPDTITILKHKNLLKEGDCVIHVGSIPLNLHGRTNMMKVSYV